MQEIKGDLFAYPTEALCLTTNGYRKKDGTAVMGRGVAFQARKQWPEVAEALGIHLKENGNHVGAALIEGQVIVFFPVKHAWWEAADPILIRQSAHELVEITNKYGWSVVTLPRPGCGNGKLRWEDVRPLIEDLLDDRFIILEKENE